jgi:hypothetical protein
VEVDGVANSIKKDAEEEEAITPTTTSEPTESVLPTSEAAKASEEAPTEQPANPTMHADLFPASPPRPGHTRPPGPSPEAQLQRAVRACKTCGIPLARDQACLDCSSDVDSHLHQQSDLAAAPVIHHSNTTPKNEDGEEQDCCPADCDCGLEDDSDAQHVSWALELAQEVEVEVGTQVTSGQLLEFDGLSIGIVPLRSSVADTDSVQIAPDALRSATQTPTVATGSDTPQAQTVAPSTPTRVAGPGKTMSKFKLKPNAKKAKSKKGKKK